MAIIIEQVYFFLVKKTGSKSVFLVCVRVHVCGTAVQWSSSEEYSLVNIVKAPFTHSWQSAAVVGSGEGRQEA